VSQRDKGPLGGDGLAIGGGKEWGFLLKGGRSQVWFVGRQFGRIGWGKSLEFAFGTAVLRVLGSRPQHARTTDQRIDSPSRFMNDS